jgi:hypothetical protein
MAALGINKPQNKIFIPYKYYLSWADGNGDRILIITQRSGRVDLSMVSFTLSEKEGVLDCSSWNQISSFEMESVIKGLESEVGLQQVHHALGIQTLEGGLWLTLEKRSVLPPSFLAIRRILGKQKIRPCQYEIDISALEVYVDQQIYPELLGESSYLLEHSPFCNWYFHDPDIKEFIFSRKTLLKGQKLRQGTINQFIKMIYEKRRSLLQSRFLYTADFMKQISSRNYFRQIQTCIAIYQAINKGVSLLEIPLIRQLAEMNIERIRAEKSPDS